MRIQYRKIVASLWTVINVVAITALVTGCAAATPTPAPPTATLPPPTPTATATVTPTPSPTATLTPTATLDYQATLAFKNTATADAELAVVQKAATDLGITLDPGKLVWMDNESTPMSIEHYSSYRFFPVAGYAIKDFIIHTQVQWDSTSGLAGCGILFRTDEDINQGAHYDFLLTRLQGSPRWVLRYFKFQQVQTNISGSPVYAKEINDQPNSSNELLVLAKGSDLTVFINGKKMGSYKNDKLTEGQIGFSVWQESGSTSCEFSNNWLYVLD